MSTRWKRITADWKPILPISILLFLPLMWLGVSRGYSDLWLFAIAMALGSWHVSEFAVGGYRRLRRTGSKERHSGYNCVQATPDCACCEFVRQGAGAPDTDRSAASSA